jgi:hypothetical protein
MAAHKMPENYYTVHSWLLLTTACSEASGSHLLHRLLLLLLADIPLLCMVNRYYCLANPRPLRGAS